MANVKELSKLTPQVVSKPSDPLSSKTSQASAPTLDPRIPLQLQLNPQKILALQSVIGNRAVVQLLNGLQPPASADRAEHVHQTAAKGVEGAGQPLPHLEKIQPAFGQHDLSQVRAYMGNEAKVASHNIGAEAYATGNKIAFAESKPSLHVVAHEAAHVIQQQAGVQLQNGIGKVDDYYEQHANAVADAIVAGKSAKTLLEQYQPALKPLTNVSAHIVQGYDIKQVNYKTSEEANLVRKYRAKTVKCDKDIDSAAMVNVASLVDKAGTFVAESSSGRGDPDNLFHAERMVIGQSLCERFKQNPTAVSITLDKELNGNFLKQYKTREDAEPAKPAKLYTERKPCDTCKVILGQALKDTDEVYYSYEIFSAKHELEANFFNEIHKEDYENMPDELECETQKKLKDLSFRIQYSISILKERAESLTEDEKNRDAVALEALVNSCMLSKSTILAQYSNPWVSAKAKGVNFLMWLNEVEEFYKAI